MELRQIRYFVTLAEHRQFARAAAVLNVSAPGLTMQIKVLERALGVELVNRTTRSFKLTNAGAVFLEEAKATLVQAEKAQRAARRAGCDPDAS
jgi:DNA-binding transcriptional LysR family regulator